MLLHPKIKETPPSSEPSPMASVHKYICLSRSLGLSPYQSHLSLGDSQLLWFVGSCFSVFSMLDWVVLDAAVVHMIHIMFTLFQRVEKKRSNSKDTANRILRGKYTVD